MQTAENQTKPNQTQTDITVEEFAQSILTAEEHLSGVSVETVFRKGKRFPVFKTTGGVRFQYITQTKDDNPIYMMKETNTDGKTVKADLTQDDIKSFQATIAPLKENGMLKAHLGKDEDGNAALYLEMLPVPESEDGNGLTHWPAPDYTGLNKWQLHSSRDKVLVNGYCQLINAALRFRSIPYTKEGQEAKNSKKGHAQHGLIQILADINGDNRKMSLKKSDGQGVNPGYLLTGRGTTSNTSDNEAHQKLIDAGITGFPVAAYPRKGNSWRHALDCNARIRQYFVDLTIAADGLPTLVVVDA